jgi:hypothetical protein
MGSTKKKCQRKKMVIDNPLDRASARDSELGVELNVLPVCDASFEANGEIIKVGEIIKDVGDARTKKVAVAVASTLGTVITGVVLIMLSSVSSRVSETKPCAPLAELGPAYEAGDCHNVDAGSTCEVFCAIGYASKGVRASAQFSCPANNRDGSASPSGSPHVCTDIDGCVDSPCSNNPPVVCTDIAAPSSGHTCGPCPPGYSGDGATCSDVNGCAGAPCFTAVACHDVAAPGSGFTCDPCPTGFSGDGENCNDINDCTTAPCGRHGTCTDAGTHAYTCSCDLHYMYEKGITGVNGTCEVKHPCEAREDDCLASATCNHEGPGQHSCMCADGFSGDGIISGSGCTDIDGCAAALNGGCFPGVVCMDVAAPGNGRTCGAQHGTCPEGYRGDGETCTQENVCPPLGGVTYHTTAVTYHISNDVAVWTVVTGTTSPRWQQACPAGQRPLGGATATWICQSDGSWSSGAPDCVPVWASVLGENSAVNPVGKTFTLFKLPPRYPAFPDNVAGAQQYADACAAYGLQTIGCGYNLGAWPGINTVTPPGMGMPESWGCNIYINWKSVTYLQADGSMYGVDAAGVAITAPGAGYAPVCALAH